MDKKPGTLDGGGRPDALVAVSLGSKAWARRELVHPAMAFLALLAVAPSMGFAFRVWPWKTWAALAGFLVLFASLAFAPLRALAAEPPYIAADAEGLRIRYLAPGLLWRSTWVQETIPWSELGPVEVAVQGPSSPGNSGASSSAFFVALPRQGRPRLLLPVRQFQEDPEEIVAGIERARREFALRAGAPPGDRT